MTCMRKDTYGLNLTYLKCERKRRFSHVALRYDKCFG